MARKKTARAVEPNAGVRKAYTKAVAKMQTDFQDFVASQILGFLEKRHALTADALVPNKTPEQRQRERYLRRKLLTEVAKRNPDILKADLDKFIAENMAQWTQLLETASRSTVQKYVDAIAFSAGAAQRASFIAAKLPQGLIKKAFTVPTVKNRYISQQALNVLPELVKNNVDLITKINADDVSRLSETILNGLQNGLDYNKIKDELRKTAGFSEKRVQTVCRDQVAKITTSVQAENAKSVGITKAVWVHVPGQYSSRASHIKMDGKSFDLNEGLFDEAVGRNVMPGELINCRCIMRMIIPEDFE